MPPTPLDCHMLCTQIHTCPPIIHTISFWPPLDIKLKETLRDMVSLYCQTVHHTIVTTAQNYHSLCLHSLNYERLHRWVFLAFPHVHNVRWMWVDIGGRGLTAKTMHLFQTLACTHLNTEYPFHVQFASTHPRNIPRSSSFFAGLSHPCIVKANGK